MEVRVSNACMSVFVLWSLSDLQDEVRDEGRGFVLVQVVVFSAQHGEKQFEKLHGLHQHTGVRVEEAQREPLQDQVQAADHGVWLAIHVLEDEKHDNAVIKVLKKLSTNLVLFAFNVYSARTLS